MWSFWTWHLVPNTMFCLLNDLFSRNNFTLSERFTVVTFPACFQNLLAGALGYCLWLCSSLQLPRLLSPPPDVLSPLVNSVCVQCLTALMLSVGFLLLPNSMSTRNSNVFCYSFCQCNHEMRSSDVSLIVALSAWLSLPTKSRWFSLSWTGRMLSRKEIYLFCQDN